MSREENKDLDYWKKNAEEDYMQVPISVLRYISELEEAVKSTIMDYEKLKKLLIKNMNINEKTMHVLSMGEYVKRITVKEFFEVLENAINTVVGQSEQLVCDNHRPDLEHFMNYSESICKNCKQKV